LLFIRAGQKKERYEKKPDGGGGDVEEKVFETVLISLISLPFLDPRTPKLRPRVPFSQLPPSPPQKSLPRLSTLLRRTTFWLFALPNVERIENSLGKRRETPGVVACRFVVMSRTKNLGRL
jgi:hypothetical protein